jgi:hypothetical protein
LLIVVPLALLVAAVTGGVALWENHAMETVTYRGRDYIDPADISASEVKARWAPLRDAHAKSHGLEIVIPAGQIISGFAPTVLLLRRGDGTFSIYGLSGGP